MRNETFKVGELARHIPKNPGSIGVRHIGAIVEVAAPLGSAPDLIDGVAHIVRAPNGDLFRACPSALRKLPPPQDWVKLCQLDNVPEDRFLIECVIQRVTP